MLGIPDVFNLIEEYKYLILFPATVINGPVVMVIAGFLYRLGSLTFLPTYFILMAADLVGDMLWYGVGHFGARRFIIRHGRFLSITEEAFEKLSAGFRKHQNLILLVSKMTMGFGFALATLTVAGAARVPFKKYMLLNFLGGFVWTGFLLLVGFIFGHLYAIIEEGFKASFLVFVAVLFAAMLYGFSRFMRERFLSAKP